ncbi:MAG: hypothetical protein WEB88_03070 [Gemmatimonadota bacterium]
MHTEHLQNVRPGRVAAGWLVAVAVTSLILMVFLAARLLEGDRPVAEAVWTLIAVAAGFGGGGFFVGFRGVEAPVLHGVALGITTLVMWLMLNILAVTFMPDAAWEALGPVLAAALLFLQMVAAVVGALLGYNLALRGRPGLSE